MIITNTSINNMINWIKHPIVKEYSISADWDNRWRTGGRLDEVIDEAHLSAKWQLESIIKKYYPKMSTQMPLYFLIIHSQRKTDVKKIRILGLTIDVVSPSRKLLVIFWGVSKFLLFFFSVGL